METILVAAAEAIKNQTPAITSDAGRLKSITLELELSNGGDVVDSVCWVERRGAHRRKGGLTMQRWEYLFVEVSEHRDRTGTTLSVGSSIDRYKRGDIRNPVPGDIPSFMDELGADGWEMINCRSDLNPGRFFPIRSLEAVFKRPKVED